MDEIGVPSLEPLLYFCLPYYRIRPDVVHVNASAVNDVPPCEPGCGTVDPDGKDFPGQRN